MRKKIANALDRNSFSKESVSSFIGQFFHFSNARDEQGNPEITKYEFINQKFCLETEWEVDALFEEVGVYKCSILSFRRLIIKIINSKIREETENNFLVANINEIIGKHGFILTPNENSSKYRTIYEFKNQDYKGSKSPQRLIFGAKGVKPNFGIIDVMDGDIALVANDGEALIYDRKIIDHLTWSELEEWWEETNIDPKTNLKKRLIDSLDSDAEIIFFKTYFALFHSSLDHNLPALIPQVYVAYDPLSAKDLPNGKTRIRQRVDFLMILPNLKRIIIEIDGKHHYSKDDGRADPHRYAEMVKVDRELRLRGYEVFRFGGAEFYNKYSSNTLEENTKILVEVFFNNLFKIYEVLN